MDVKDFVGFAEHASRRAMTAPGQIGQLILTHLSDRLQSRIREPEIRHALAQECEFRNQRYGIEVPTSIKYRFSKGHGERKVAARHDMVLFDNELHRDVLIEFKEGQIHVSELECPRISKDLQKLIGEPTATGSCMFHLINAGSESTIQRVLDKYRLSWSKAIGRVGGPVTERWFVLILLVRRMQEKAGRNQPRRPDFYYAVMDSMTGLDPERFFLRANLKRLEID